MSSFSKSSLGTSIRRWWKSRTQATVIHCVSQISFLPEGIHFLNYPFAPASVYHAPLLPLRKIVCVILPPFQPEILTDGGELLLIGAPQKNVLIKYAQDQAIPIIQAPGIWSEIQEPFLDTEFTVGQQAATLSQLAQLGISEQECQQWRKRIEGTMMEYNMLTGLWDWVDLGLYDLLAAHSTKLIPEDFQEFYGELMSFPVGWLRQGGYLK